jgi:uncharacterized cupredoxin-like copper-binding protein
MRRFLILALLAGAVVLSSCGSSSDSTSSTPSSSAPTPKASAGQTIKLNADADGGLYFEPRKLKAKSGTVTLAMDNPSSTGKQHGIAVEGNGVDKDGQIVSPGSKSTITVTLKPGTYEYYCPVPGHKAAGMKGTLVVS